jgi:hypothetical protein
MKSKRSLRRVEDVILNRGMMPPKDYWTFAENNKEMQKKCGSPE